MKHKTWTQLTKHCGKQYYLYLSLKSIIKIMKILTSALDLFYVFIREEVMFDSRTNHKTIWLTAVLE